MALLLAALLAVGCLVFTLLVRARDIPEALPPSPTQHLEERKARIYENLRDLQFEYRLGKLSDEDYQKTKIGLQRELAQTLAEIDAVLPLKPIRESKPVKASKECPSCGAKFPQPLRFCGACGKAMS
jgi:hypothetical protein